ncbi:MAG: prephenate dehydratase, partial [Anaerolineaceae bacterium]|nr:prephenate dehydratase [Anaerolineaceae bacterium]
MSQQERSRHSRRETATEKSQSVDARLDDLRARIDELDVQIVDLLNKRAEVVVEVGKRKQAIGSTQIYSPDREHQVLANIARLNKGPLKKETLAAVYKELMSGSFALEKPLKIVYLGPDGSFSHLAARQHFGASVEYVPVRDIATVFDSIARGFGDYGLVPIENTTGGSVTDTLNGFLSTHVTVCAELELPIHQNLLANCPACDIKVVYSKPQVFDQCRTWLSHNLPKAELVEMPSTTAAAQRAASEPNSGAIASHLAAELYEINIAFEAIEDNSQNLTRFLALGREGPPPTGNDKTSLLFSVVHRHGALVEVLSIFNAKGINMTKIESHPSPFKKWEYYFFVDIEGHREDAGLREAVAESREHCKQLEILGSYP